MTLKVTLMMYLKLLRFISTAILNTINRKQPSPPFPTEECTRQLRLIPLAFCYKGYMNHQVIFQWTLQGTKRGRRNIEKDLIMTSYNENQAQY